MTNDRSTAASAWGADESTNYLDYPTLMPVPQRAEPGRRSAELQAEVQRLLAEERKRVEREVQRLLTESQTRTEAALECLLSTALEPGMAQPTQKRRKQNRMGKVGDRTSELSLDGVTPKGNVKEVRFLDTLAGAPGTAADLSEAKDRSVLCWTEEGVQYIAGEGGVAAGASCKDLFYEYTGMTAIRFDGNFDTSAVTNMRAVFSGCKSLTELNVSGWNTANVTDMSWLFYGCAALTKLDVSEWNTASATNMQAMFEGCTSLISLNLSGWNTASVKDMRAMFHGCKSLTFLNVAGWNTRGVRDMRWMFYGCSALKHSDTARLDTNSAQTWEMYSAKKWGK
ncbi:MAG: DUF285 domain-containing protein [Clostridiales bacterium]|nr:DUF285 domain-containing protein [Clostridiales bacterium]